MRTPHKLTSVLLKLVACVIVGVFVFFTISFGGSSSKILETYSSLSAERTVNEISKKYTFVAKYTFATQDITFAQAAGFTKDEAEVMQATGTISSNMGGGANPQGPNVTGEFALDASMAVASKFIKHGQPDSPAGYSLGSGGWCYNYSQNGSTGRSDTIEYDGKSFSTLHRDCSCYTSAMRYLLGASSRFAHFSTRTIENVGCVDVTSSIHTLADCQVGDILWRSGHVAMIVKIEGGVVYVGDCGSASTSDNPEISIGDRIDLTAAQGYAYTLSTSDTMPIMNFTKIYR